jgi:hypothetical protein
MGSSYATHRLNAPVLPAKPAESLCLSHFTGGSGLLCYCLRISNVDVGDLDPRAVLNVILGMAEREDWGEILMISVHLEVDDTWAVDVGFRHVEDAAVMWTRHGKRVLGRYWNIVPMESVLGIGFVARDLGIGQRSMQERIQRLKSCELLEEMLEQSQPAADGQLLRHATRLTQIQSLLTRLNGILYDPSATFPAGSLINDWADIFIDGHDHVDLSYDLTSEPLDGLWPRVYSQALDWTSEPLPSATTPSFSLYQVEMFTPPPPRVCTTPVTDSAKKHARQRERRREMLSRDSSMDSTISSTGSIVSSSERLMTKPEIARSIRNTRHNALIKHGCWNSQLLPLPDVPERVQAQVFSDEMLGIWDWYDDCLSIIRDAYIKSGLSALPALSLDTVSRIKDESFLAAERSFAPAARLTKLFGREYQEIMDRATRREFNISDPYLRRLTRCQGFSLYPMIRALRSHLQVLVLLFQLSTTQTLMPPLRLSHPTAMLVGRS